MNALKLILEHIHPFWIIAKFTLWGGSPSTPADTTNVQTMELPEWARGYAKETLAKTSALTDINKNPYQQYGGERIAGFQPMQQQAFETAANMQPSAQVGLGSNIAGMAGLGALGTNYQGGQFQGGQFDTQAAQQYMSPYTQNVVDYQKAQALRDFQIAQPMRQAQAVKQGAFGGSRSAIMDAEAQRALNSQLQGIEATGQQAAFQNAQQQFNTDMARRLQANKWVNSHVSMALVLAFKDCRLDCKLRVLLGSWAKLNMANRWASTNCKRNMVRSSKHKHSVLWILLIRTS